MTMKLGSISVRGLVVALAACAAFGGQIAGSAAATPYQSKMLGGGFGYAQKQLDTNRWLVKFVGDADTPRKTVETYLLYRAAELTLKKGGDWFETSETKAAPKAAADHFKRSSFAGLNVGPAGSPQFQYFQSVPASSGAAGDPASNPGQGVGAGPTQGYVASAEITMGKGPPPADRKVLAVREVMARLGPSIVRPVGDKRPQD